MEKEQRVKEDPEYKEIMEVIERIKTQSEKA